jgi:2-polyprenyl-3-methyl-5-hydroxy-6-metoxy-1,4-benzoquinol methylase
MFSQYYDELMGERITDSKKVMNYIKESGIIGNELLDVACGTGSNLKYFLNKGFNVMGLDISEQMLNIAKNKLPHIHFEKMNMTDFKINKSFDIITCLYDSINHLLSFSEWKNFFNTSFNHLKDNGILIFDMNTLYKLKELSQKHTFKKIVGDKSITMEISDLGDNIFNWNTQIFINKSNSVDKYNENIKETSFEIADINNYLLKIFRNVQMIDQDGNKINNVSKRVYFLCKK